MVNAFYDQTFTLPDDGSLEGKWTPAEVNQILFRNFETPRKALQELVRLTRDDLYGFDYENGSSHTQDEAPIPTA
jgi:hypothetical protein